MEMRGIQLIQGHQAWENVRMLNWNRRLYPHPGLNNHVLAINHPPMVFNNPRMAVNNQPLAINNPPMAINNPPMAINNPPMAINNPPMAINNPAFGLNNPPQPRNDVFGPNPRHNIFLPRRLAIDEHRPPPAHDNFYMRFLQAAGRQRFNIEEQRPPLAHQQADLGNLAPEPARPVENCRAIPAGPRNENVQGGANFHGFRYGYIPAYQYERLDHLRRIQLPEIRREQRQPQGPPAHAIGQAPPLPAAQAPPAAAARAPPPPARALPPAAQAPPPPAQAAPPGPEVDDNQHLENILVRILVTQTLIDPEREEFAQLEWEIRENLAVVTPEAMALFWNHVKRYGNEESSRHVRNFVTELVPERFQANLIPKLPQVELRLLDLTRVRPHLPRQCVLVPDLPPPIMGPRPRHPFPLRQRPIQQGPPPIQQNAIPQNVVPQRVVPQVAPEPEVVQPPQQPPYVGHMRPAHAVDHNYQRIRHQFMQIHQHLTELENLARQFP
jgi:hypothetical protein